MNEQTLEQISGKPIDSSNPAGVDLRYEPFFRNLEKELAKLNNPVLEGERFVYLPVDWELVIDQCSLALVERSKDLRILAWLIQALTETEGIYGLSNGLKMMNAMIANFWDGLYPTNLKAKIAVIARVSDMLSERFDSGSKQKAIPLASRDIPVLELAVKECERLGTRLKELAPDEQSRMFSLAKRLKDKLGSITDQAFNEAVNPSPVVPEPVQSEVKPPPVEPLSNAPTRPSGTSSAQPEQVAIPAKSYDFSKNEDVISYFEDVQEHAQSLHFVSVKNRSQNPLPYRFVRLAIWSACKLTPAAERVPLNGPDIQLQAKFESLLENSNWEDLFFMCEGNFVRFWFWIDLQRYCLTALDQMGGEWEEIADGIRTELTFFLRSRKYLINLRTLNGMNVARPETIEWACDLLFKEMSRSVTGRGKSGGQSESDHPSENDSIDYSSFESSAAAIAAVSTTLGTTRSVRTQVVHELRLAEYLIRQGELAFVPRLADLIERRLSDFRVEEWDPEFALWMMRVACEIAIKASRQKGESKELWTERSQRLIAKIAAIDPALALKLQKTTK